MQNINFIYYFLEGKGFPNANKIFLLLSDRFILSLKDTTCRVWDRSSHRCVGLFRGHCGRGIFSAAVSPSEHLIATGGADSGVRLWNLQELESSKSGKNL